jgi:hypothetical protein
LNVDDDIVRPKPHLISRFGHAIRARTVLLSGHHRPAAQAGDHIKNSGIIGGHNGFRNAVRAAASLADMGDHGFLSDFGQRFPLKSSGTISGGNNDNGFHEMPLFFKFYSSEAFFIVKRNLC